MIKQCLRTVVIIYFMLSLTSCSYLCPVYRSQLCFGERLFANRLYRRAMHQLLPLACAGCPSAEYAVGYMYYYGYGVAEDTRVGCCWISKAARHHYPRAICAIQILNNPMLNPIYGNTPMHTTIKRRYYYDIQTRSKPRYRTY